MHLQVSVNQQAATVGYKLQAIAFMQFNLLLPFLYICNERIKTHVFTLYRIFD